MNVSFMLYQYKLILHRKKLQGAIIWNLLCKINRYPFERGYFIANYQSTQSVHLYMYPKNSLKYWNTYRLLSPFLYITRTLKKSDLRQWSSIIKNPMIKNISGKLIARRALKNSANILDKRLFISAGMQTEWFTRRQ